MAPQIGQRATLGGKTVVWSGENYGWQSPASHKKLEQDGKFKLGTQAIDRLVSSAASNPIVQRLGKAQQQLREATDKVPLLGPALNAIEKNGQAAIDKSPHGVVDRGAGIATNAITSRLNVDPRLALVGMVAGGGAFRGPRGANGRALPSTRKITDFDPATGRGQGWIPVDSPGKPRVTLPNGQRVQLTDTAGSWQKSPFQATRNPDGSTSLSYDNPAATTPRRADQFIQDRLVEGQTKNGPVTQYGQPVNRPAANKPAQNPPPGPGNPRQQRVHVEGPPGPKRLEKGYNVKPEDMARPRGDGNSYGPFERVSELPDGWEKTGNFITRNDQAYRLNRDKMRKTFLEGKASAKDFSSVREAVAWADGDLDTLNGILTSLGGTKQRYASNAQRAIERRLGALENKYGGKPSLSKAERRAATDQWDWQNLNGTDKREAERLSELATQRFGAGTQGRRPITQQPAPGFKGGQVPPEIQRRLDDVPTRGGRAPRRTPQSPPEPAVRTERADRLQASRDAALNTSATKPPYQPKLSDAERAAARAARANRPLRPASVRAGRKPPAPPKGMNPIEWLRKQLGR